MRTQAAHLDHLKSIPLFSYCTRKELRTLAAHSTPVPAQTGRTLIRQGEVGDEFFVVVAGRAEVSRDGVVVDTVGPGDYFGELAMLERRRAMPRWRLPTRWICSSSAAPTSRAPCSPRR